MKMLVVVGLFLGVASAQAQSSGGCYNLQLIAQNTKQVSSNENNGHRIFLLMGGNTKILLQEGPFGVIDYNGTDGSASFRLPNPDPLNTGITTYSVYMRLVGRPGTAIDMRTCGIDALGDTYCSEAAINMSRQKGKSSFQNVSRELLYVYADLNDDGTVERTPLFSDALEEYFWDVDAQGRAHAQLRFCPDSTNVN